MLPLEIPDFFKEQNIILKFFLQIVVRINGGKLKHNDELKLELTDGLNLKSVIKQSMKKLAKSEGYSAAKIYNKNGVMLFENDFSLIAHGDILYLAPRGKLNFISPISFRRGFQLLRDSRRL